MRMTLAPGGSGSAAAKSDWDADLAIELDSISGLAGYDDADPISSWLDETANNVDASASGAARPTKQTDSDGIPYAAFTTDDYLDLGSGFQPARHWTMAMVFQPDAEITSSSPAQALLGGPYVGNNPNCSVVLGASSSLATNETLAVRHMTESVLTKAGSYALGRYSRSNISAAKHILYLNSENAFSLDGVTPTVYPYGTYTPGQLYPGQSLALFGHAMTRIGAHGSTPGNFLEGRIYYVACWDGYAFDPHTRDIVLAYLQARFNTVALP